MLDTFRLPGGCMTVGAALDPLVAALEPFFGTPDGAIEKILRAETDVPVLPFPPSAKHPWVFVTNGLRTLGPAQEFMVAVHDTRLPGSDKAQFYRQPPFASAITLLNKITDFARSETIFSEQTIIMDEPVFPGSALDCVLVFPPVLMPAEATQPTVDGRTTIDLMCLYPLHRSERDFAAQDGTRALLPLLFTAPMAGQIFNPDRPACEVPS